MIHLLLTRNFRTRNPIYLVIMALVGVFYSLNGILPFAIGNPYGIFIGIIYSPYLVIGVALLVNVYLSLRLEKENENEDNGYKTFCIIT